MYFSKEYIAFLKVIIPSGPSIDGGCHEIVNRIEKPVDPHGSKRI
jgi:hypothetical protein